MATTCSIVWLRRDLRLEDNPALLTAARAGPVVPVFIYCPEEEGQFQPGRVSRWWLKQSLIHLDVSTRSLGAPLVMRRAKDTLSVLIELVQATGASQVVYNHLYDPISLVRDHRVKQGLTQRGIQVQSFNGDLLYEPWEVYDEGGKPFTTFEAYWQKSLAMPFEPESPLLPPRCLIKAKGNFSNCTAEELCLEDETEKSSNALLARAWSPGWSNADKALDSFLAGPLLQYAKNRQKIDVPTTSLLSPHLHFGEISVRKLFHSVRRKQVLWARDSLTVGEESVNLFLRSVGFREYSRYLCFNFPFTHERSLLSNLKSFPWRVDEGYFKSWRQGRTGYPLVDAGMRELWATGWQHNRVRVIVASFCVKFLQLPWRWGMKYFWDTLLDADLENDVLGWQYISGSLPDGHELDRMDNPQTEGDKYDPQGEYVRRWLPELARLPTEWIHHPWDAPPSVLRAAGVELGSNYPRPIVELAAARERLQQAVSQMWEQEAALKAAVANGQEEGLGETLEIRGIACLTPETEAPRTLKREEFSSGTSRHDQRVPNVKELKFQEAHPLESIKSAPPAVTQQTNQQNFSHELKTREVLQASLTSNVKAPFQTQAQWPTVIQAPLADSEVNSTAESSSSKKGQCCEITCGALPAWSPILDSSQQTPENGINPVRRHLVTMHEGDIKDAPAENKVEGDLSVRWAKRAKRKHMGDC